MFGQTRNYSLNFQNLTKLRLEADFINITTE